MRPLKIVVIDLVTKSPTRALYSRIMNANLASIMPQVIGIWCEEEGHEVTFLCYTGFEDLNELLPQQADLVFIGAFTQSAQLAYAMSNRFRKNGALTVLGGPHARCYPQDAQKYFDYVLGFTDQEIIRNVLGDMSPHRPLGLRLSGDRQPLSLPGVRQRWKFIEPGDVEAAMQTAAAIGDDRLQRQSQGRVVPDSFTHGSSEQRLRWFKRGLDSGRPSDCDTFSATSL